MDQRYENSLLKRIRELEKKLDDEEKAGTRWREAWEESVGRIGDLIHAIRQRKQGRRFATVIDLAALLAAHND